MKIGVSLLIGERKTELASLLLHLLSLLALANRGEGVHALGKSFHRFDLTSPKLLSLDKGFDEFGNICNRAALCKGIQAGFLQVGLLEQAFIAEDLTRPCVGNENSLMQHQRALGIFQGKVHIVRNEKDGKAECAIQFREELHQGRIA
ncbi:hypothetical protein SDC9_171770 [bioreactor metagenome]|uniref:Uncharacterized protein n=1 Tax=bioreactor metagenome TaxID=1076179 RepID=A0A645GED1_9ZZZZ